ncbi:MAG: hypothetical protein L6U99_01165 [Clostridium sp.]|nr:MAG: hypothetical protein L6U99_01165 [Clostridium sp.]
MFDDYLIISYLLVAYIKLNDLKKANKYADLLLKKINSDITDSTDLVDAYFALARYYNYISDFDNAYNYYLKIFLITTIIYLDQKLIALDEMIPIFKKI